MDDAGILALYLARDERAVRETADKYGPYCRTVAGRILEDPQDAEECVNDAWLRAWNAIPPDRPERLGAYLTKIVRNLALDRYRAGRSGKRGGGELTAVLDELAQCCPAPEDAESACLARELEERINRFVRTLPEREGNVFIRRYFFAEPTADIARRYGLTRHHVHVILGRTRQKLRRELNQEGFEL